jgi:hypothetical protein
VQIASKNHRFVIGLFGASIGLTAAFASCTDSYDKDLTGSSSGTPGGSGSAAGGAGGGFINPDGGCYPSCSNDLKSVLDCFGNVTKACTPDEGCYEDPKLGPDCIPDPCHVAELAKSSLGCDYWALKTAQRPQADGACFAAFVANTWSKPVHLTVDRDGTPLDPKLFTFIPSGQGVNTTYTAYDPAAGLAVGQVAILFLSRDKFGNLITCPKAPALDIETGVVGTGVGKAFHITSDYPVVAYQIDPYGGGTVSVAAATLLIPTSAWDKDYLAISAYPASPIFTGGVPSLNVLAYQDQTAVTITPTANIIAGVGVPGGTAGMPVTYNLNKGEFLQVTQTAELTGSPINADKPIGVFGAHTCMSIPQMVAACDSAQQQIPPAHALGSEYVAVRHKNRTAQDEAPPWRVVGAADNTVLTWIPATPPGAPKMLNVGQVAEFSAAGPFVVTSQDAKHPFYLAGYMTGGDTAQFLKYGDPEWVNVIPPPQYLNHYVLFTDPTYPETSLVVVRTLSKMNPPTFADVTLDCLGKALDGWQPIGKYEYTVVNLVTGDFMNVGNCTNGRHEMSSALPFGVTVWGWGTTQQTPLVSYAYPAGAGFKSINDVIIGTPK